MWGRKEKEIKRTDTEGMFLLLQVFILSCCVSMYPVRKCPAVNIAIMVSSGGYSSSTKRSPSPTVSPGVQWTLFTLAVLAAVILFCIFMASITQIS